MPKSEYLIVNFYDDDVVKVAFAADTVKEAKDYMNTWFNQDGVLLVKLIEYSKNTFVPKRSTKRESYFVKVK